MYLCVKLFLDVDEALEKFLLTYEMGFKNEIKRICELFKKQNGTFEYRYRFFSKSISYNSKHLVLEEAKRMYKCLQDDENYRCDYSSYWSNSSYTVTTEYLKIELGPDYFRDRLLIPIYKNEHSLKRIFSGKPMNMKLVKQHNKWHAKIYVFFEPEPNTNKKVMGIDLGIKVPAVCALSGGDIHFFGNGREIRFTQRKYKAHIVAMQKRKQIEKLTRFQHKLSHILSNYDHKISKEIVQYAKEHNVGIIKMERLTSINKRFHVNNNPDIYLWSYRRLQDYIAYKAELEGIEIKYINPYHTSQTCPNCGMLNKAVDRDYRCSCGYHKHRDVVAAINIMNAL